MIQALGLQAPEPAFHVGVEVRALRRQQDDFSVRVLLQELPHGDEAGVSIHDEMAGVFQASMFAIVEITADLFHPPSIGARRDPGNVDTACLQVHHSEHIERDEPVPRPDFDGGVYRW